MASFRGTIRSEALKMKTKLTVIIPDTLQSTDRYPVVYLLHGLSGNTDDWSDGSQVWLLAKAYNLIFVIPEVQRSFYTDMEFGPAYFTYISQELPALCKKLSHLSQTGGYIHYGTFYGRLRRFEMRFEVSGAVCRMRGVFSRLHFTGSRKVFRRSNGLH